MTKCPNCGSTAQMRFIDSEHCGRHLREVWDCCGCKRRYRFLFKLEHIVTQDIAPSEDNTRMISTRLPSNMTVGGQMVRRLIEEYEGRGR